MTEEFRPKIAGPNFCIAEGMGVRRFTDLRAWQACDLSKKAVYGLCANGPLARDFELRDQIKDSVAGRPGHIAEGFGRFDPPDFARFARMASSSLMESQSHLRDAVDRRHITEEAASSSSR